MKEYSDEEFMQLVEEKGYRPVAKLLNSTKSKVTHKYKTLKFKPYSEERICSSCGSRFTHKVKSYRDSTKICPQCRKQSMREINAKYIKNKPSHRRLTLQTPEVIEHLNKSFLKAHKDQKGAKASYARFKCMCGKVIERRIKRILPGTSQIKSCGCVKSSPENEIEQFLKELGIGAVRNKKYDFLGGLELDFYIPEKGLAIEYHGLAHHSERPVFGPKDLRKVKTQHRDKFLNCERAQIELIQIFEDEWLEKPQIVKSIIRNKLRLNTEKVYARECQVTELSNKEVKHFFDTNHIAGNTLCKKAFGLYYKGELVSCISLRDPFTKAHKGSIEIARFASRLNINVVGGFQKLLKRTKNWAVDNDYNSIMTYADCRWGSGGVYGKAGFEYLGYSKPNYFYEKRQKREGRFKHRKRPELEGATEREQQNNLGWYAIYDAGNKAYKLLL